MLNDNHPENDSDIPSITLPIGGFVSKIPAYILKGKDEDEAYLLHEISKTSVALEFLGPVIISINEQCRKTNGRTKRNEYDIAKLKEDKRFLKRGWHTVVIVASTVGSVIVFLAEVYKALHP